MLKSLKLYICKKIELQKEKKKIAEMDYIYNHCFGSCFNPFPPSFYYLHTPEEAARIKKETYERVLKLIDELED